MHIKLKSAVIVVAVSVFGFNANQSIAEGYPGQPSYDDLARFQVGGSTWRGGQSGAGFENGVGDKYSGSSGTDRFMLNANGNGNLCDLPSCDQTHYSFRGNVWQDSDSGLSAQRNDEGPLVGGAGGESAGDVNFNASRYVNENGSQPISDSVAYGVRGTASRNGSGGTSFEGGQGTSYLEIHGNDSVDMFLQAEGNLCGNQPCEQVRYGFYGTANQQSASGSYVERHGPGAIIAGAGGGSHGNVEFDLGKSFDPNDGQYTGGGLTVSPNNP